MFDFNPEAFPSMLRNPAFMAAAASAAQVGATPSFPPPMKKSRKSAEPRPRGGSPTKDAQKKSKLKNSNPVINSNSLQTNNNFEDMEEGGLKIDEDADPGKENLEAANKMENDDIAEIDNSNGVSEEEEEPSMPGPGGELAEAANEIINPWTGGKFNLSEEAEDNHAQDDTGLVGWPNMLGEFSETAHNPNLPPSQLATPTKINNGSAGQQGSAS